MSYRRATCETSPSQNRPAPSAGFLVLTATEEHFARRLLLQPIGSAEKDISCNVKNSQGFSPALTPQAQI